MSDDRTAEMAGRLVARADELLSEPKSKTTHWSATDAARALVEALDLTRELREQEDRYNYSLPDGLRRDQARAAEQIRNALAYFNEMDAPSE